MARAGGLVLSFAIVAMTLSPLAMMPAASLEYGLQYIVLNEFMANPSGPDSSDEWIELHNTWEYQVDVGGCRVGDDATYQRTIDAGTVIPGHGFLVIYGSDYGSLSLNNGGDTVRLFAPGGEELDNHTYTNSSTDVSEGREWDGAQSWSFFAFPTPGESNDGVGKAGGPVISDVTVAELGDTWALLEWSTDVPATSEIRWSDDPGLAGYATTANTGWTTAHAVNLTGLDGSTTYYFEVASEFDGNLTRESAKGEYYNFTTYASLSDLAHIGISEFLPTPRNRYDEEWVELANTGGKRVNLGGCYLDDELDGGKSAYNIPDGTFIEADARLLFERSFGLNQAGDELNLLWRDRATVIQNISYTASEPDVSFGMNGDGEIYSYGLPTPGAPNKPDPPGEPPGIMLTRVFYGGLSDYEFFSIHNPADAAVDMSEWRLSDGEGSVIFPVGSTLVAHQNITVACNATAFEEIMGELPDYESCNTSALPQMLEGSWPILSNVGDVVFLKDAWGRLVDTVVYGDEEETYDGWAGEPVPKASKGEYMERNWNASFSGFEDTDSWTDWGHLEVHIVGQSGMPVSSFEYQGEAVGYCSPDCSYGILIEEMELAEDTLDVNLYEITSMPLGFALVNASKRGVRVRLLLEGGPVGWSWDDRAEDEMTDSCEEAYTERWLVSRLAGAGGEVRFLVVNDSISGVGQRYRYDHAKYFVADSKTVVIQSENWKPTGVPTPRGFGNRGWGVALKNAGVAGYFQEAFQEDWEGVMYDIFEYDENDTKYGSPPEYFVPHYNSTDWRAPAFQAKRITGEFRVTPVLAPDNVLDGRTLLGLIASAERSILLQQLDCRLVWDQEEGLANPYLEAVLDAARRGCEVKVLLDSRYADPADPGLDNYDTVQYVNDYADEHGLGEGLRAQLADLYRMSVSKIHNKGMVVDGDKVLVSSLNWNHASSVYNREVGVIVENAELGAYFATIFRHDWKASLPRPIPDAGGNRTVYAGAKVVFDASNSTGEGGIVAWSWDFDGDGYFDSEGLSVAWKFSRAGVYDVLLNVTDAEGNYNTTTITVIVLETDALESNLGLALAASLPLLIITAMIFIVQWWGGRKNRPPKGPKIPKEDASDTTTETEEETEKPPDKDG